MIKLRAWIKNDNHSGIMVYSQPIESKRDITPAGFEVDSGTCLDDLIIMQWSGSKDINGIDIYEGDIVKHENEKYFVLGIDEQSYYTSAFSVLDNYPIGKRERLLEELYPFEVEVIGNVYENWELL